jgi:hypothetical protein
MLSHVISGYDRLDQVRSCYDRLGYDSSGWIRLYEVSKC